MHWQKRAFESDEELCEDEPFYEDEEPNEVTIAAMEEAERIAHDPSVKAYSDLNELFAELKR